MARPIKRGEKIPKAIRRLARSDLGKARNEVAKRRVSLSDRVHDLRTAVKKVRAIARMVRPHDRPAAKANRRLRKIARELAPIREAEVMLATFDRLVRAPGIRKHNSAQARRLRGELARRLHETTAEFERQGRLGRIRSSLTRARRRVKRWEPRWGGWHAIGRGLEEGYGRARQTMMDAYRERTGPAFHAWRRATKSHRHQVHALLEVNRAELEPRLEKLDRLGDLLGDEHDLAILEAALSERNEIGEAEGVPAALLRELAERRARLRGEARRLGRVLFREDGRRFKARLKGAFRRYTKQKGPG